MVTGGSIYLSGDFLCQTVVGGEIETDFDFFKNDDNESVTKGFNIFRLLKMTALGFFVSGPIAHIWFRYIQPYFADVILLKYGRKYFYN